MRAVYRHELSSYFSNLFGYLFGTFLLFFAGIYTLILNIRGQIANFEYVFGNMSFIFLIIIPVITMKVLAEERRQGTDQLLYALPISATQIILGKYAAMLVTFAIPMGIICLYPLIFSAYGSVHMPAVFTAAAGFFLLGASLLAVGMFISAVTENPAISAGVCFAVVLLNYYLKGIAGLLPSGALASVAILAVLIALFAAIIWKMTGSNFTALLTGILLETGMLLMFVIKPEIFIGLIGKIAEELSLFERFHMFVYGIFDISGLIYFCSVIAFFLFLSVQSLERRRWR